MDRPVCCHCRGPLVAPVGSVRIDRPGRKAVYSVCTDCADRLEERLRRPARGPVELEGTGPPALETKANR
jgi:hypothetical protein